MPLWKWSQTAANNGTADSTCPFPEGMAPSAVNDGVRGAMAAVAMYRDDIAGAIVTAGTSTAYTLFSYSGFDTLAHMNGAMIAFAPHATNGATVTLNVDGLGAKPLRSAPGVDLLAAMMIQSSVYAATYNNTSGEWILHGLFGNPYNVPLLAGFDFWGTVAPNSSFIFPLGQALSRTTYSAAFAVWGTTYGAGDGSTTFNAPDLAGRVRVMKEASASRLTSTYFGGNSTLMGATGGGESQTLTQAQLPNVTLSQNNTSTVAIFIATRGDAPGGGGNQVATGPVGTGGGGILRQDYNISPGATVPLGGSGNPHPIVQPTITTNCIIRVL